MPTAAIRYGDAQVVRRPRPLIGLLGDDRLVDHVRRGSHAAFEALYERHHRGMLAFCQHMLGTRHDAEEAVQQAFTAAYDDLHSGERPAALKPWLYGIARHRCLAILRKRRLDAGSDAPQEGVTPALTEEVERRSDVRDMLLGVSRLPEPQRTALVLFGLCGHSQADVAAVLHCREARVRALVFQARNSLLEDRRARDIPCQEIREKLALGRGGALRRRAVRRHIKFCPGCAEFRAEVLRQRRLMGLVAPAVPSLTLKYKVLAAVGLTGGGGAGGGSAAGLGGSLSAAKVVTAALLVAATPVGGEILMRHGADRPSSGGSVRSPASTRPGPPGPPLPILAAPLRSLLAPREGPAASLRGGLEAPAGPSDAAPGAEKPASPVADAGRPAPATAGTGSGGAPESPSPKRAPRRGTEPGGATGGSSGKAASHRPGHAGAAPGSQGQGQRSAGHGLPSPKASPSPAPAPPPGHDPARRPCAVPSVKVGQLVVPPQCPATT